MPFLQDEQCWAEICEPRGLAPALILDRDGVLVEEVGYLRRPKDVRLLPDGVAVFRGAMMHGWYVGLTTNQGGIGHGIYGWAAFHAVQAEIVRQLAEEGLKLDFVLACSAKLEHPWRKPAHGMIDHLVDKLPVQLEKSISIGDKLTDLIAADDAGVAFLVHASTGHARKEREAVKAYKFQHDLHFGLELK